MTEPSIIELIQVTVFATGILLVFCGMAWVGDRMADRSVKQAERAGQQIDPKELALTTDDYRVPVSDFIRGCHERDARRFERDARVAYAVDHACFPDNEKGVAAVEVPGPVTEGAPSV